MDYFLRTRLSGVEWDVGFVSFLSMFLFLIFSALAPQPATLGPTFGLPAPCEPGPALGPGLTLGPAPPFGLGPTLGPGRTLGPWPV